MTQSTPEGAGTAVARAGWQSVIFATEPRRLAVLGLQPGWPLASLRISIHRNSGVEIFTPPLSKFLAYVGFDAKFDIGDYDDSLSFRAGADPAVDLIWLDIDRYARDSAELRSWLLDRLASRRQTHSSPIIVGIVAQDPKLATELELALAEATRGMGGILICDVSRIAADLGPAFRSERTGTVTASPLSNRAAMEVARVLAFEWLPTVLLPRIKAIAVDLDGTLYEGVLGEDGPSNITVTPDHARLQERLRSYGVAGVLLVLTSKNTPADVERMFELRSDFILGPQDFVDSEVGWTDKAVSIRRAAERLRIAPEAFLFVDDNLGEIAALSASIPGIQSLLAVDPGETARALAMYPGLSGYPASDADSVRAKDLDAARIREGAAAEAQDGDAYIRSLGVTLTLAKNSLDQLSRLRELSVKTNQFNTALSRFSEAEVARRIRASDCCVVSVALKDRLSDSGVIAAIHSRREGSELVVDEIAISCRALGRGLEDAIISAALVCSVRELDVSRVRVVVREGPRNEPARTWVDALDGEIDADGSVSVEAFESRLATFDDAVVIAWGERDA